MRILVTGGAGFIGSAFVRLTLRLHPEDQVLVLDKLTYAGNQSNLAEFDGDHRFRFVAGDIRDVKLVTDLAEHVDGIVNFAAETHVDRSLISPDEFLLTDIVGTHVLLRAAYRARHRWFLQVSTDEVYGEVNEGRSLETDALHPRSPYSASKAAAEMMVSAYRASYELPVITTRGCNTYGPFQYPEKIIPLFVTNAIDGLPLPVFGDGLAVRDYLFVDDHCAGIDFALRHGQPGRDYNIGGGTELSGLSVAHAIVDTLEQDPALVVFVPDRRGHDRRYAVDSGALRQLGWEPTVTFSRGLEQTIAWYRDHQSWWRPLVERPLPVGRRTGARRHANATSVDGAPRPVR